MHRCDFVSEYLQSWLPTAILNEIGANANELRALLVFRAAGRRLAMLGVRRPVDSEITCVMLLSERFCCC
jgi:hypothetical protein